MKKLVITCAATLALALGAYAQGNSAIDLGNGLSGALDVDTLGNYYSGPVSLELWELAGTTIPAGINLTPAAGYAVAAYAALTLPATGFTQIGGTYSQTISSANAGTFEFGQVNLNTTPAGSSVVLGIAAWNSTASSFNNMLANATGTTRAGVLAFVNPTASQVPTPLPPSFLANASDIVMMTVPEPGTFALAGLGAAALLIFRRRK